ncbi:hypothetical protein AMTR_s00065p00116270 [Amborella trichopoda]|uniref:Uncharacterized protein n=1 Tax=Amborella trichopoda TaxID=13333 RepID=U5DDU3_AMBTC|nr:hypothetical protein AMTR_s00065p00116270 [Amborella trichopoda]
MDSAAANLDAYPHVSPSLLSEEFPPLAERSPLVSPLSMDSQFVEDMDLAQGNLDKVMDIMGFRYKARRKP